MTQTRRETVCAAFDHLLEHQVAAWSMHTDKVTPNLFLWGALALVGKHRVEGLDANLRADVAAEFLIEDDTARHGITKEFALRRFDQDGDVCCLSLSDWLYFFGVETKSEPQDGDADEGTPADLLLFRSVPLVHSNPLGLLQAFLASKLQFLSFTKQLVGDEADERVRVGQEESASRDDIQSTIRRRLYAAALRARLDDDRQLAKREEELKMVREETENDTADLQKLRWEQAAVQRSIEATRDAAVKLEISIQDSIDYVRRCGDQFCVFKKYKTTLMDLCSNEIQDGVSNVRAVVESHHRKFDGRLDAMEERIVLAGRLLMMTSASKRGRAEHMATLDRCNAQHKAAHQGELLDYSWLAATGDVPAEENDESIVQWMLRDTTLFVPPSVLGSQRSMQITRDAVGIVQRVFQRLCASSGELHAPKGGIGFPAFAAFVDSSGIGRNLRGSLSLEFEAFCPTDRPSMDYEGWLQFLASQATMMYPKFAANLSRPLLIDLLCKSNLVPWLHSEALRDAGGRSAHNHHHSTQSPTKVRGPGVFDLRELLEEGIGSLCVTHSALLAFLERFSVHAEDYPAAPIPRIGCAYLRSEHLLQCDCLTDDVKPALEAPSVLQALQLGGSSLTRLRKSLSESYQQGLHTNSGNATLDACCGWLSVHVPLDVSCPPRHVLLLYMADALVRIVQASFVSHTEGALRLWPHSSVSTLVFECAVPPMLDTNPSEADVVAVGVPLDSLLRIEATAIGAPLFLAIVTLLSHEMPEVFVSLEEILAALCAKTR